MWVIIKLSINKSYQSKVLQQFRTHTHSSCTIHPTFILIRAQWGWLPKIVDGIENTSSLLQGYSKIKERYWPSLTFWASPLPHSSSPSWFPGPCTWWWGWWRCSPGPSSTVTSLLSHWQSQTEMSHSCDQLCAMGHLSWPGASAQWESALGVGGHKN